MKKKLLLLVNILLILSLMIFASCGEAEDDDDRDSDRSHSSKEDDDNEDKNIFDMFADMNQEGDEGVSENESDAFDGEDNSEDIDGEESENFPTVPSTPTMPEMTDEEITLTYSFWGDIEISRELAYQFEILYPNINVELKEFSVSENDNELFALAAVGQLPDCFWVLNDYDELIKERLLYDMSEFWEADPETTNIIKGINEYKLGYYGTEGKWLTPVKFYPTAAFVNIDAFTRNNVSMPAVDWTWEEFETTVEEMTMIDKVDGRQVYGYTSGSCNVVTWYPLAADKECIGEFGWNGAEFDMENWAYGFNLESEWINNEVTYSGYDFYPQDTGQSAIHSDSWYTWEDYWSKDNWILENKVVFVPYMMPHTDEAQGGSYIATMDMGGISAHTEHPREAYELLKFMTWGAEGWTYKLEAYPNLVEESTGGDSLVSKNSMPITLDEYVWEGFANWYPNLNIGDEYITSLYGYDYDRSYYFDYFINEVQNVTWTTFGNAQIPGFTDWLYSQDYLDITSSASDPFDYYLKLEELGNTYNMNALIELENSINVMR